MCLLKWTIVSMHALYSMDPNWAPQLANLYLNTNETEMSSLASQK